MNLKMRNLFVIGLLLTTLSIAQTKKKPAPVVHNHDYVYSDTWDQAEVKSCTTWSDGKYILICDDTNLAWPGSYINILGAHAQEGKDEAHKSAVRYAMTHAKAFKINFSKEPWPESAKPGSRQNIWECTKGATSITCKFNVGEGT